MGDEDEPGRGPLESTLIAALETEPTEERDAATRALALTYAAGIDRGGDLTKLGPSLLSALEALHLSPRARAAARKGMKTGAPASGSKLDELRQRRDRKSGAAAGDAATS